MDNDLGAGRIQQDTEGAAQMQQEASARVLAARDREFLRREGNMLVVGIGLVPNMRVRGAVWSVTVCRSRAGCT